MSTTITIAETMPAAAGGVAPAAAERASWLSRAASRRGQVSARARTRHGRSAAARTLAGTHPHSEGSPTEGLVTAHVSGAWLAR